MKYLEIVFDGPPSHESGRFVEVENEHGCGVKVGEWVDRGNDLWALRLPANTTYDDVGDFHKKFDLPDARGLSHGDPPELLSPQDMVDRVTFILEELSEFCAAHRRGDLEAAADGLADLAWVVLGTAHLMGLPFDAVWAEVRRANMDKVRDERNKFKVGKPEGWRPPDLSFLTRGFTR